MTTNNIATNVAETNEKKIAKQGLTKEEILISIDIALAFCFDPDGKVKEGNLPADLTAEFNRGKLGRLLELDNEDKRMWWAVNEVCRANRGGAEFVTVEKAFRFVKTRFTEIDAYYTKRTELFAEIERLNLDPSRAEDLSNDEITERLSKEIARRKAKALGEVKTALDMVNLLEKRLGFSDEELTVTDLDPQTCTKAVVDKTMQELIGIKRELEEELLKKERGLKHRMPFKAA